AHAIARARRWKRRSTRCSRPCCATTRRSWNNCCARWCRSSTSRPRRWCRCTRRASEGRWLAAARRAAMRCHIVHGTCMAALSIQNAQGDPRMLGPVRKAVFPVAGLGTRFLPATKTVAKEMLPVVDRPLIQYAVDEAIEAGCDTLVFSTNRYKHAVADYFDKAYELEHKLEQAGKHELLAMIRDVLPPHVRTVFVTQPEALGLGHAVLCAEPVVRDEPFAVLLPDDLIWNAGPGCLRQMVDVAAQEQASVIAVQD